MAGVASLSVMGIGWQLGASALDAHQAMASATPATAGTLATGSGSAPVPAPATASTVSGAASGAAAAATAAQAAADAAAAASAAAAAPQSGTFAGSIVQTQYGTVQVSVTIANGAITDVTSVKLTDRGGRSVAISNQAAPILRSEVLTAQSAKVSNVGGATYTTFGYLTSLQAALDAAHF